MLKLRLLTGPRAGRQLRVSDTKPVSVGRRVGRLRLHDTRVSKHHAEISFTGGTWVLRDLGSSNGTYINRLRVKGLVELETGDVVQMGRVLIKIVQADAVGMARPRPRSRGGAALGVDAFTPSGASGVLPAIVLDKPFDDDADLAALFGETDDDLIDVSDQSRADATRFGSLAGQTLSEEEIVEIEPITDEEQHAGDEHRAPEDNADALLDGPYGDGPDTSGDDLVAIEDDTPDAGKSPGTTMLTAISDEKPEVVGLRLDQRPPMQPAQPDDADVEVDAAGEAEAEPAVEPQAERQDTQAVAETEDTGPSVIAELAAEADEPAAVFDDAEPVEQDAAIEPEAFAEPAATRADTGRAADASLTEPEAPQAEDDVEPDADELELAHAELTLDETADLLPQFDLAEALTELGLDEGESDQATPAAETPARDAEEPDAHAKGATDAVHQAVHQEEAEAPEALVEAGEAPPADDDTVTVEGASPEDETAGDEPEVFAETAEADTDETAPVEDESLPAATAMPFDIDAAFDALAEGLDDSMRLPAITDGKTETPGAAPEEMDWSLDDAEFEAAEAAEAVEAVDDAGPLGVESDPTEAPSEQEVSLMQAAMSAAESAPEPEPEPEAEAEAEADVLAETKADVEAQAQTDIESPAEAEPRDADIDDSDADAGLDADIPKADLGLAGSQLDIAFIRDALSRLGDSSEAVADEPASRERTPRGSADEPAPARGSAVADELAQDERTQDAEAHDGMGRNGHAVSPAAGPARVPQPPPGINPTSMMPPTEPARSYRPYGKRSQLARWFYTAVMMLIVLGLGTLLGYYVVNNPQITGRSDADPGTGTEPSAPQPGPSGLDGSSDNASPSTTPDAGSSAGRTATTLPPVVSAPFRPDPDTAPRVGESDIPDPFATGPTILGDQALAGMTSRAGANDADLPGSTAPEGPGSNPIVSPDLPTSDGNRPATNPGGNTGGVTPDTTANSSRSDTNTTPPAPTLPEGTGRIVFLVDASGSMVDSLPQMLVWLGEAVDTLEADERFTVIFFKADRAIEAEPAGLKPLTRDYRKLLAENWLDPDAAPVLPAGRSDPTAALALALSYKPTDLYVLSDESFARNAGDTTQQQAMQLVTSALSGAAIRVHGVQFFYQDRGGVLETLASRYHGTYEFVKEDIVADQNPIDLLEELGSNN